MNIKLTFLKIAILSMVSVFSVVNAAPVQISADGLKLNADYIKHEGVAQDSDAPVMVILHGTWMHHTAELPSYLQETFDYEGYSTLNISLSLGIDNRETNLDCEKMPVVGGHSLAITELKAWFDWLTEQGHSEFVLVAHSRGGAQASLFSQTYHYPGLNQLVLLAPMVFDEANVKEHFETHYSKNLDEQIAYFESLENKKDPITEASVLYCNDANVSSDAFLDAYLPTPNKHTPNLISQTDIPTKVFLGTEDSISKKFMEYESEFMDNSSVTTIWLDGADHFFRDLYSDEIVEAVIDDL